MIKLKNIDYVFNGECNVCGCSISGYYDIFQSDEYFITTECRFCGNKKNYILLDSDIKKQWLARQHKRQEEEYWFNMKLSEINGAVSSHDTD